MTLSITMPDDIGNRLSTLPQAERDLEVSAALSLKWSIEQDEETRRADNDVQAWDAQIEADLAAGKLDLLLAEVDAEIAAGRIYDAPRSVPRSLMPSLWFPLFHSDERGEQGIGTG